MPYCTHCGAENAPQAKFCQKCGKALGPAAQPQQPSAAAPQRPAKAAAEAHPQHDTVKICIFGGIGVYGLGVLLTLAGGAWLGVILSAGLCAALYFLGFAKLKEHDYEGVKNACLGVGIAAAAIFLINLLGTKDMGGALFNAIAAGAVLYAYYLLRE